MCLCVLCIFVTAELEEKITQMDEQIVKGHAEVDTWTTYKVANCLISCTVDHSTAVPYN